MNPSESTYDVVVVGAGIVGAACADFLMKAGVGSARVRAPRMELVSAD
jgi:glycine/D-amino acid oxidase-like deaminating enzyme